MQKVQYWLQPCMMLTKAVTDFRAVAVEQMLANRRLAPGSSATSTTFSRRPARRSSRYSAVRWNFCVPRTRSTSGSRSISSCPRLCAMQPRKPSTTLGRRRRVSPAMFSILLQAFCSAISRTLHVLSRIDIGGGLGRGQGIALGHELRGDGFAVALVHLATVGLDVNARHLC